MTPDEFQRSDAFHSSITQTWTAICIAGDDLLAGVEVRADDLRRACEVQAKAHLIHLRRLDEGGDHRAQVELDRRSRCRAHHIAAHDRPRP
jgi:hypothetical protein